MLLKETILWGVDNSGAKQARVIHLYSKQMYHGKELILIVLRRFDIRRKLQAKKKYKVIPLTNTPRRERLGGSMMKFSKTAIIFMADNKRRLLGTRIYTATMREVRSIPLEKAIIQKIISYSRYTV